MIILKILSVKNYSSLIQIHLHNTFLITFYPENTLSDNPVHNSNSRRSITDNNFNHKSIYSQSSCGYLHDRRKKRTELGQLLQILKYVGSSDNTQISSIARSNNMSHDAKLEIVKNSLARDLLQKKLFVIVKDTSLQMKADLFLMTVKISKMFCVDIICVICYIIKNSAKTCNSTTEFEIIN